MNSVTRKNCDSPFCISLSPPLLSFPDLSSLSRGAKFVRQQRKRKREETDLSFANTYWPSAVRRYKLYRVCTANSKDSRSFTGVIRRRIDTDDELHSARSRTTYILRPTPLVVPYKRISRRSSTIIRNESNCRAPIEPTSKQSTSSSPFFLPFSPLRDISQTYRRSFHPRTL